MKYQLCLTQNLAKTKSLLQAGNMFSLSWSDLVNYFFDLQNSNISEDKDTMGFTIGEYRTYSFNEWRLKLYQKYLKLEDMYNRNKEEKYLRTWKMINSEEKRINIIKNLFLNGYNFTTGFHRVNIDIINKQSIIIDYDNKISKIPTIKHNEILEILEILKCNYILYSSYNNSKEREKFRVIIPTDRPFTTAENLLIKESIVNIFTVRMYQDVIYDLLDFTSFEPSRFFYVPVNKSENMDKWF
jgi:hypothetical protein